MSGPSPVSKSLIPASLTYFSVMRNSPILRFCVYITSFLSSVSAFSVTFGTPTQCDPFAVSWTGGQAPFEILLTPFNQDLLNVSVPSSAFSNGKGSYSIPQLPFASGTQFLLTMSDATRFGSGGTTIILNVGAPVANNNCNTTGSQDFNFTTTSTLQQCGSYTFHGYNNAVLPVKITGLIPGGISFILYPSSVTTPSYTWVADVQEVTSLLFFTTDSRLGVGQGGVDNIKQVANSTDASCLNVNSPSSTTSTPTQTTQTTQTAQTSSQSAPSQSQSKSSSNTSTVGIIAGAAVGSVVLLVILIVPGIYCKRKASRSLDFTSSRRLQRKDDGCEMIVDDQVTQNFTHRTEHVNSLPSQPESQQHLRQDSFAGSSASRRMPAMSDQMASQNTFPDQRLPVGLALPIHPGTNSHPTNTSVDNSAVIDTYDPYDPFTQIRPSHLSPNTGSLTMHASDASASRQMTATTDQASSPNNPFPYQTAPVHFAPPNQPGTLSHHRSANSFTVSNGDSPLNSTQSPHLSSDIDVFARYTGAGSSSMSSSGRRIATAAGPTRTNPPPQIIVHVDSEDVPAGQDARDVIELPPQYVERRFLVTGPASVPNQKPS